MKRISVLVLALAVMVGACFAVTTSDAMALSDSDAAAVLGG